MSITPDEFYNTIATVIPPSTSVIDRWMEHVVLPELVKQKSAGHKRPAYVLNGKPLLIEDTQYAFDFVLDHLRSTGYNIEHSHFYGTAYIMGVPTTYGII